MLKRTVKENVSKDSWDREKDNLELFEVSQNGYAPISNPKDRLNLGLHAIFKSVFPIVGRDFLKIMIGLSVSVAIVLCIHYVFN